MQCNSITSPRGWDKSSGSSLEVEGTGSEFSIKGVFSKGSLVTRSKISGVNDKLEVSWIAIIKGIMHGKHSSGFSRTDHLKTSKHSITWLCLTISTTSSPR